MRHLLLKFRRQGGKYSVEARKTIKANLVSKSDTAAQEATLTSCGTPDGCSRHKNQASFYMQKLYAWQLKENSRKGRILSVNLPDIYGQVRDFPYIWFEKVSMTHVWSQLPVATLNRYVWLMPSLGYILLNSIAFGENNHICNLAAKGHVGPQ